LNGLTVPLSALISETVAAMIGELGLERDDSVVEKLAARWQEGTLVLRPSDSTLQSKETPLEVFFQLCSAGCMLWVVFSAQGLWRAENIGKVTMICHSQRTRAKHGPERFRIKTLPSTESGFFLGPGALQERDQVFLGGQARPVPL
jgi:hypothetical protein